METRGAAKLCKATASWNVEQARKMKERLAALRAAAKVITGKFATAYAAARDTIGSLCSSTTVDNLRHKISYQEERLLGKDSSLIAALASDDSQPDSSDQAPPALTDPADENLADAWTHAYKFASTLYHHHGYSCRGAAATAKARYGCGPNYATVYRSVCPPTSDLDYQPPHRGPHSIYPLEAYTMIKDWIAHLRARNLLVEKNLVKSNMYAILPERAQRWFGGEDGSRQVTDYFYHQLLEKFPADLQAPSTTHAHESRRAAWTTSANLKKHYDLIAEEAVRLNIATWNEEYDENNRHSEKIFWSHPERVFSFDETDCPLGTTKSDVSSGRSLKSVRAGANDKGLIIGAKTTFRATGVGGSSGNGDPLPARFIMQSAAGTLDPTCCIGGPVAVYRGKPFHCTFGANDTGAAKNNETLRYIQQNIMPLLNPPPSADLGALLICDCYADHYTNELVQWCSQRYISVQLRVPNTSSATQNEDLVNFGTFKTLFGNAKKRAFTELVASTTGKTLSLPRQMLIPLIKDPWERAFDRSHNLAAWGVEGAGLVPFTRTPYWTIRDQEAATAATAARAHPAPVQPVELQPAALSSHISTSVVAQATQAEAADSGRKRGKKRLSAGELAMEGPVTGPAISAKILAISEQQQQAEIDKRVREFLRHERQNVAAALNEAKKERRVAEKCKRAVQKLRTNCERDGQAIPEDTPTLDELGNEVQEISQIIAHLEADLANIATDYAMYSVAGGVAIDAEENGTGDGGAEDEDMEVNSENMEDME